MPEGVRGGSREPVLFSGGEGWAEDDPHPLAHLGALRPRVAPGRGLPSSGAAARAHRFPWGSTG